MCRREECSRRRREQPLGTPYARGVTLATGVGSLPGTVSDEATRIVAGELTDLPHLVELPARGPGADMVGRTMGLLSDVAADLAVDTTPAGWRVADAPGRTMRRARSWLAEDLDAAEQQYSGSPRIKVQVCGPWTLAAAIEGRSGERVVRDHGACRDIGQALAEAVRGHVADVRRRLPHADVVVQVDEPALPTVLAGGVTTASGLATYRSVHEPRAEAVLRDVTTAISDAGARSIAHCCDGRIPVDLLQRSGFRGISADLTTLTPEQVTPLGAALDADLDLHLGVIPALDRALPHRVVAEHAAGLVLERIQRWGFAIDTVSPRPVVTPTCGMAGASPGWVRTAYAALREAVRLLSDEVEGSQDS